MEHIERLRRLSEEGRMRWSDAQRGWVANPDDVVHALSSEGYQEYQRENARIGGVWQGLDTRTGAVASAVWVRGPDASGPLVFIAIDGRPVERDV